MTSGSASAAAAGEVEEALKRIASHRGVLGSVVVSSDGVPIRTTLDKAATVQHAALLTHLAHKARAVVRELSAAAAAARGGDAAAGAAAAADDDLSVLRVRSRKHEIIVAPANDYILIVLQNPSVD
eukprot:jgi/Chlat1/6943/Chrsp52S00519